jgi:hypothetical protein
VCSHLTLGFFQASQVSQGCRGHREIQGGSECPVPKEITAGQGTGAYQVRDSLLHRQLNYSQSFRDKPPGCKKWSAGHPLWRLLSLGPV